MQKFLLAPLVPAGVNLLKRFWSKFTHSFCKLDYFNTKSFFLLSALKRTSLQKRESKFTPIKFY
jgi:hypothetical protein